jgi:hypothetical protein
MQAKRKIQRRIYRIVPYDHANRWLCLKPDDSAYLVELNYFGSGQHACGCRWFEFHKWDGPPIKPCIHIRQVVAHIVRLSRRVESTR